MKDIRVAKVYQLINRKTGEHYIGSTKNKIATRWSYHYEKLKHGSHEVRELQKAWDDSDISDWDFRILEDDIPVEQQFDKELQWQELLNPTFGSKTYWHRKSNQEKKDRAIELIKAGKSYRDIAKELSVSIGWVSFVKMTYVCSVPFIFDRESKVSIKTEQAEKLN